MILIVGSGHLGSAVAEEITKRTDEKVVATVRNTENCFFNNIVHFEICDVLNKKSVDCLFEKYKGERIKVFYFVSCHNPDYVFEHSKESKQINIDALLYFLEKFTNIEKLIYSSTDCVYGENNSLVKFTENSPLNPVNEYGRQKRKAEEIIIKKGFNVARLPLLFGETPSPKKNFYDVCLEKLLTDTPIEMADDFVRSPLSYKTAAEILCELMEKENIPEVINVCGDDSLSKYDIGLLLLKKTEKSEQLIKRITFYENNMLFKEKRARISVMDNSLLKKILGTDYIKFDL